jgi:hypothetical protein
MERTEFNKVINFIQTIGIDIEVRSLSYLELKECFLTGVLIKDGD